MQGLKPPQALVLAGFALGGLLFVATRKRKPGELPRQTITNVDKRQHGIVVQDGRLVIVDQTAWFAWMPAAVEEAVRSGARGADGVLVNIMRRALPNLAWPPPSDTKIAEQWKLMVITIAELLNLELEPDPQSTERRFHVVR